ncbi:ribulokinase [Clostridia bacterium]|nr:ribulokinase [Clostridia bacterium]
MGRYSIGVDFGTLSGRALVVDVATGEELGSAVMEYRHGVIDDALPCGKKLDMDWALQYPTDYIDVLRKTIPEALGISRVSAADVIALGIDFTACTLMPVKADGTPLCMMPEWEDNPHAYIKLWKHHAAQDQANRINALAERRGEPWLRRYGGKISSEWALPKILQVLEEAAQVYDAADYFIEAGDWVTWQLTGKQTRNACMAGYKELYNKRDGYPSKEFFKALNPRLENLVQDKLNCPISPMGAKAGQLYEESAQLIGLKPGTAVAVANVDAHVTAPAVKAAPGAMLAIMGTSTCHIIVGPEEKVVPGMCGVVEDGVYEGYFGFEAGQSCVGDHFAWFVENCMTARDALAGHKLNMTAHEYLTHKAQQLKAGESGLVALDWWNGNRSVLVDVDLSGLIVGMTLDTKSEEIYRALIEATAYGTRVIVENFRESGVPVDSFIAAGGIALRNPMMMQIYADVLRMPIRIAGTDQGPALGSAIFGALAAGRQNGGYDSVFDASAKMGKLLDKAYEPIAANADVYDKLYAEYLALHDWFGRGGNDVMKRLKNIKKESMQ